MKHLVICYCILLTLMSCKSSNDTTAEAIKLNDRLDAKYQSTLIEETLDPKYASKPERSTTTVQYMNPEQLADFMIKGSAYRDYPEKQATERSRILTSYQGGDITLIIERPEPFNLAYFSVIIKTLQEDSIYRKDLDPDRLEPTYHQQTENWMNNQSVQVPVYIRPPFYAYVEDRKFHTMHKFLIEEK